MPNYCNYSMCVKGTKESVEEFIKVIQADYDYGTMEFSHDRHLFRVFEAEYDEVEEVYNGIYQVIIKGYCAWSVNCCMLDTSKSSYYKSLKTDYPCEFRGTTLPIESKRLNLDIEVFSEEGGMCFQEHYVILKGDIVCDDCVDWQEYYIGEFNSKEEAERELGIEITDEEWNSEEDYIGRGGFGDWDFEI